MKTLLKAIEAMVGLPILLVLMLRVTGLNPTNTWYLIPHSVTIYCVSYQNQLYLQSVGKT
jgi:hypothetical protein